MNVAPTTGILAVSANRLPALPESNPVVNPRRSVKQRFREFLAEISGFAANLYGWFRTHVSVSRNGEFPAWARIGVNPCRKGVKRKTPGRRKIDVGR
jgi:hypothetical protein